MNIPSEKEAPLRPQSPGRHAPAPRIPRPRSGADAPAGPVPPPVRLAPTAPEEPRVLPSGGRETGLRSRLGRIRAWMLVTPVDAALLLLPVLWTSASLAASLAMTVLAVSMACRFSRYRSRLDLSVVDDLPHLLSRLLMAAAVVATVIALGQDRAALTAFLAQVAWGVGLVVAGRVATTQVILWSRRRRITAHRTVLIGGGALCAQLTEILDRHPRYGLVVVGYVDDVPAGGDRPGLPARLGRLVDLDDAVRRTGADVLLVGDGEFDEGVLHDAVRTGACIDCDLLVVPRMHSFHTHTGLADQIGPIPVMRVRTPNLNGPARAVKRAFDIVVAGAMLVMVTPLLAALMLAVRLEGGPDVFFLQPRVGRDGRVFNCIKLRSMRPVDEKESATKWSIADDDRIGPVGRFLRATSLDELPQLWNILRGDMTLVGPRPERPYFVEQYSARYDRYAHRHRVQAGLTGFAQVSGLRGDTPIADRARHDNYYIENWSLWLDIKILLRTFSEVLFARGR